MDIHVTRHEVGALVELAERLDATAAGELDAAVSPLLDEGVRQVVVDLARVERVESDGLRQLLSLRSRIASRGGRMMLAGVGSQLHKALEVAGMARSFRLVASAAEAFAELSAEAEAQRMAVRVSDLLERADQRGRGGDDA